MHTSQSQLSYSLDKGVHAIARNIKKRKYQFKMSSGEEHCHSGCSSDHEHGDDDWIEMERVYQEKSTEELSIIDWLTKNVHKYLSSVSIS